MSSLENILGRITALDLRLEEALHPIAEEFQALLQSLEGEQFGSLENNRQFTEAVRGLVGKLGRRVQCPTCGESSYMRTTTARRVKTGLFQFQHMAAGIRQSHASKTKVPRIVLVKPNR